MIAQRIRGASARLAALVALAAAPAVAQDGFVNWEVPVVHPIDLSPDGRWLAAANLPDGRVEFLDLQGGLPVLDEFDSVATGVNPTSVRWRNASELWVVNHISDSISVVDAATRRVVHTIQTADEPFDLVFAGDPVRAYVSCSAVNLVQVFDPETRERLEEIAILGEDPRAMAVSPDGSQVYVAIFESGNGTTLLGGGIDDSITIALGRIGFPPNVVNDPMTPYGGQNPPPNDFSDPENPTFDPPLRPGNPAAPRVGLIVRKDEDGHWRDDNGTDWTLWVSGVMAEESGRPEGWDLPDRDLAIIDTATHRTSYVPRLMNICMAVGVNPATGRVHVVGTEAINEVRFEPKVNGIFVRVHMAIVDPAGPTRLDVVDLNPQLDYTERTVPQSMRDQAIGDPRDIVWTSDGARGFVTGLGSNNLIVVDRDGARIGSPVELEEGPSGVVVDEARSLLYVYSRFSQSIEVLNLATLERVGDPHRFFDPQGFEIKVGRKHLYDTHKNSGLGQVACASCHVDSRMDRLAWDLGDPSGEMKTVNFVLDSQIPGSEAGTHNLLGRDVTINGVGLGQVEFEDFHPMKGPMTTQTLQDIIGHEPLHWRGDRDGIEEFNGAFIGLQADDTNLTADEMQEFENFLATIHFPPNPFRNFDNTMSTRVPLPGHFEPEVVQFVGGQPILNPAFQPGRPLVDGNALRGMNDLYRSGGAGGRNLDAGQLACVTCHTLSTGMGPVGALAANLSFVPLADGPNGEQHLGMVSVDGSTNVSMKIPHLRNVYDKVGFDTTQQENLAGFGFLHDGGVDSIARFVTEPVFTIATPQELADVVAFQLSFAGGDMPRPLPSLFEPEGAVGRDTHAAVGKQFTIAAAGDVPSVSIDGQARNMLDVMIEEARENGQNPTRGTDLIVKGRVNGRNRGWVYDRQGQNFRSDLDGESVSRTNLLAMAAAGSELTFTVVPRGTGDRYGVDRDGDGFGDATEDDAGSDKNDPLSVPGVLLENLSTRGRVGTGDEVMIAGIIVGGNLARDILVSGVGPNLGDLGVADPLANPTLTLLQGSTVIASNDNWMDAENVTAIMESGFAPANALEAAIRITLDPGEYTAILSGVDAGTGNGLVQLFDLTGSASVGNNLSTRGRVGTADEVLIAGFIVGGNQSARVLIRGLGPTIGAPPFNVAGALADPQLGLFRGSTELATNDSWALATNVAEIVATGLQPANVLEPAILVTLEPGSYTAILSGVGGITGNGLVEVYQLD